MNKAQPDKPFPAGAGITLDDAVRAEQVRLLIEEHVERYLTVLIAAIVVAVVWRIYPIWVLAIWFVSSAALVFGRAALARRYRAAPRAPQQVRSWASIFAAAAGAAGTLWGFVGSITLFTTSPAQQFFAVMVAGGMMAGGLMVNAAYGPAMAAFSIPAVLPCLLILLSRADLQHAGVAIVLAIFGGVIMSAAIKLNRVITQNIRLRFEHDAMLAQVQSSESAMAEAQQLAKTGSWSLDLKSQILTLSPEAYRIFGIEPANPAPHMSLVMARVHPDDKAIVEESAASLVTRSDLAGFDHRSIMDDGEIKYLHITPKTIFNDAKLATRASGSVQDVTAQRHAEDHLLLSNLLLKTQMEASPDGIQVANAQREMISFNQHFGEIWRVPTAEMKIGNDVFLRSHMAAQVKVPESYAERIQRIIGLPDETCEDEVLLADGRILERHTRPLRTADGRALGRVWFFRDITARHLAAQKLEFANILLETQMEASPDGILVVDSNRNMVSCNQRFAKIWQIPAAEAHPGNDAALRVHILAQVTSPETYQARIDYLVAHPDAIGEDEFLTTDGRTIERFSQSLVSPSGEHLGRVWFFGDVTQRKAAERQLMLGNALLKTQLEASPDGIYVVGKDREILSYNQRFVDMFSLSEAQMLAAERGWLRREVGKQLKDQEAFTDRIAFLNLNPSERADDVLETIDGRIIEQHSVSLTATDQNLGRAWFYRDITARRASEALTLRLARYDVLTGLANRAVFVEAVNQAIAHARRENTSFAVLFLDLDHFKDVNDTLGHPAGDALLKAVAARLLAATRETDTVGRFGGDEFAVILSGIQDAAGAGVLAEKLITAINVPLAIEINTVHVRASIGIELFSPNAEDSDTLLAHADVALYRAKAEGRGTFRFFTSAMDTDVRGRVTLGTELREALSAGELFLLYQPQVEASTGRLTGLEALIRWRHPTRGILLPETFIEAAETTGAIAQLSHLVLWTICRQAATWRDAGLEVPRVSFNVSALQFKGSTALEADITDALAAYGLPARMLELELTESVLMDTTRENSNILHRLKQLGIKLAIDDFGTGYSSLEYLRRFPADHIKIAQSFTKNIGTEASDAAIVRAIIGLANELNIATIAEGIETRAQLDLIVSWGCTHMQGYYFSRPVPPETISAILHAGGTLLPDAEPESPLCSFENVSPIPRPTLGR